MEVFVLTYQRSTWLTMVFLCLFKNFVVKKPSVVTAISSLSNLCVAYYGFFSVYFVHKVKNL